jgi:hypothetical protein
MSPVTNHTRYLEAKQRAVVNIPAREAWSREANSNSRSSTASTSSFSSEIKANRQYVVTLNSAGDLSWRSSLGGLEVGSAKVGSGGGVGDWDLSALSGGLLAVGGLDGSVC